MPHAFTNQGDNTGEARSGRRLVAIAHLPNIPIPSIKASMVYGNPRALPLVPGGNITSLGCAFLHSTY